MLNSSASGGILTPSSSPAPLQGEALDDFIHDWIMGLTGLPGENIRPRWQPEPPNIPLENVDWLAFGIMKKASDTFAAELHYPDGTGYNEIRRHEEFSVLLSFYGANADTYAELFRDGIQVAQNREILGLNNMGLIESGEIRTTPELVKQKWLNRKDLEFSIRRQIVRDYAVENILSSQVSINNEHYVEIDVI